MVGEKSEKVNSLALPPLVIHAKFAFLIRRLMSDVVRLLRFTSGNTWFELRWPPGVAFGSNKKTTSSSKKRKVSKE
jgi:hypothetical protein